MILADHGRHDGHRRHKVRVDVRVRFAAHPHIEGVHEDIGAGLQLRKADLFIDVVGAGAAPGNHRYIHAGLAAQQRRIHHRLHIQNRFFPARLPALGVRGGTGIAHNAHEFEVLAPLDVLRQRQAGLTRGMPGAGEPGMQIGQQIQLHLGRRRGFVEQFDGERIVGHGHEGGVASGQGDGARDLVLARRLARVQDVRDARTHHQLGFRHRGAGDAQAAQGHLAARDVGGFVDLAMRAQVDAIGLGVGGHRFQVAFKRREIDHHGWGR